MDELYVVVPGYEMRPGILDSMSLHDGFATEAAIGSAAERRRRIDQYMVALGPMCLRESLSNLKCNGQLPSADMTPTLQKIFI
jgi:hypothetical protein